MFVGKNDPIGETHPSLSAPRIRSSTKCAVPARGVLSSRYRRYTKSSWVTIALTPHLLEIGPGDQVLVSHLPLPYDDCTGNTVRRRADVLTFHAVRGCRFGMAQTRGSCRHVRHARRPLFRHVRLGDCGERGDLAIASPPKFFPVPEGGLIVSATRPSKELELAPRSWRDEFKAAINAIEVGFVHGRCPGLNALLGCIFRLKKWQRSHYHRQTGR